MRFQVLATDYDGTIATDGRVEEPVWTAIGRLRDLGRKTILVTGRDFEDLQVVCPNLNVFDRVVAENGAVLFNPATKQIRTLAHAPPKSFAERLQARGVHPLAIGHVILATLRPWENVLLETIRDLGLELQVIFNQESVMVLPSGVNKATGLRIALQEIGHSPEETVAVGDAENDHALLDACGCGSAVGNAVQSLKDHADIVLPGIAGAAVVELIERMVGGELACTLPR